MVVHKPYQPFDGVTQQRASLSSSNCPCVQAGQRQPDPTSRASQELPADVGSQPSRQQSLPFGVRPLFATPQSGGGAQAGAAVGDALRHTASGVNLPEGLTLDDLLRLGEEIVPAPEGGAGTAGGGSRLEGLSPMQLAAFLAAKVRHPVVCWPT